jgi:lipopolysaccharide/colanic/teichoic acid biosynthesis glycosyltransferase
MTVRLTTPGSALFYQERVGRGGRTFKILKLRSMVDGSDRQHHELAVESGQADRGQFKLQTDPRVTPVGRILRRYSIDELPQLVNVILGDMSLIGPRPPLPKEVATYDHREMRRLTVRPGMTGLWQVSGRSDLDWDRTVELDLYYVENWSMTADLVILWRTVRAVLRSNGAY